jgi:hypothetical protein
MSEDNDLSSTAEDPYEITCVLPEGVTIAPTKYGLGIFTTRKFVKDEVLYTGVYYDVPDTSVTITTSTGEVITRYPRELLLRTDQGDHPMTFEMHTVGIGHGDVTNCDSSPVTATAAHGSCDVDEAPLSHSRHRQVFTFDSFMNHSCDPNTYSADEQSLPLSLASSSTSGGGKGLSWTSGGTYKTVAHRDMEANEQITCDYDLFEYDSRNKCIEKCECGAATCRGASLGFRFLSAETQLSLLDRVYPEVLTAWLHHHPKVLYRSLRLPEGFAYRRVGDTDLHLITTRAFSAGERLHSYATEYFDVRDYDTVIVHIEAEVFEEKPSTVASRSLALETSEETEGEVERVSVSTSSSSDEPSPLQPALSATAREEGKVEEDALVSSTPTSPAHSPPQELWHEPTRLVRKLDLITHTVNRDHHLREFFGWDTFCNHSCEPNADFVYLPGSLHETETIARRDIQVGEMVTCDYSSFDTELDGSEFVCQCGTPSCKGVIRG